MTDTQPEGIEQRTCGKCGTEYDSYCIFLKDNFCAISDHESMEYRFGNVCMDCYREECPSGKYALMEY